MPRLELEYSLLLLDFHAGVYQYTWGNIVVGKSSISTTKSLFLLLRKSGTDGDLSYG